jgi:flagellar L-ring protein precursor FlgH
MSRFVVLALFVPLSACAMPATPAGQAPSLSPVGAGATQALDPQPDLTVTRSTGAAASLWRDGAAHMYRDRRAVSVGDIVTVLIDVNDQAALRSASSRSRTADAGFSVDGAIDLFGVGGEGSAGVNGNGRTSSNGQGSVQRSEQVSFSIAATVTSALPNGNLAISGLQEMRINNEMRVLGVQGIVRLKDISPDNTIRYEQIAEARVSYGGAGRLDEVQQPAFIHQLYDRVAPL